MNERIKELEVQCWEPRKYGPAWFNSKKFAELIIQESVNVIAKDLGSGMDHSDFSDGMTWGFRMAINSIKEHFGVK